MLSSEELPMLKKAFTLVELLVVTAIIAVLIAVLMPALQKARQQAQLVQCQSNLRQVALTFHMYSMENRGMAPMVAPSDGAPTSDWMLQIAPYLKVAPDKVTLNTTLPSWAPHVLRILQCPTTYRYINIWGTCSYAPNMFFTLKRTNDQFKFSAPAWWLAQYVDGPVRMNDPKVLKRAVEFILAGESVAPNQIMPSWWEMRLMPNLHRKTRNFVFVDGHVEASKPPVQYVLFISNGSNQWAGAQGQYVKGRNNHAGFGEP
jgi:prepilin-type N-terminal cleavage/methylation domain-containing protein/prepilin-type processing-associated H-X9-DG protein